MMPGKPDASIPAANKPFWALVGRPPEAASDAKPPDLLASSDRTTPGQTFTSVDVVAPVRRRRRTVSQPNDFVELKWRDRVPVAHCGAGMEVVSHGRRLIEPVRETEQLRAENVQLRKRNAELATVNERLRQFNRIAAHDLLDPIAKLLRGVAILRAAGELGQPSDPATLSIVAAVAQRAANQVNDLVNYCSVSERPLERVAMRLAPLLRTIASEAGPSPEFRFDVPADLVIRGDPRQARQIFLNLIGNAVKYRAPDRPNRIVVTATTAERALEVRIKDNGLGFPQSAAEGMFAPFRRLHGGASVPGRGLGLSIAAAAAMRHGWSIQAEGRPGQGATFAVLIPEKDIEFAVTHEVL